MGGVILVVVIVVPVLVRGVCFWLFFVGFDLKTISDVIFNVNYTTNTRGPIWAIPLIGIRLIRAILV